MSNPAQGGGKRPGPKGVAGRTGWRHRKIAVRIVLTFAIGGTGGLILAQLGAPAPWLTGAMLAVAAAALAGLPDWLRTLAFILLGTSIGSSVTPETFNAIRLWPGSFGLLFVAIVATTAAGTLHLTRLRGWDAMTARYSALPGAFSQVVVLALRSGADLPRIALAQSLRVFVLVALLPWLIPGGENGGLPIGQAVELTVGGTVVVLALGGLFGILLERLGVPAGALLGGMLASALLHGTGLVVGRLPGPLLLIGFVATGCVIGMRFRGASPLQMVSTVRGGLESVALAVVITAGIALAAQQWLGLPYGQLWLAYAPGGVEAMTIMAFALGFEQ